MLNQFSRTELLFGKEARGKQANSGGAGGGIGGVGGYTVEALVRSGIGKLDLIDDDKVCLTNLNRQIIATRSTIGKYKVDVMRDRILDINPMAEVNVHKCCYLPETRDEFDFSQYDYVVDAMDHVPAKLLLLKQMRKFHTPIITCMGIGNAWNPSCFRIADFSKTVNLPFMRKIRQELKIQKAKNIKVFYSTQEFSKKKRSVLKEDQTSVGTQVNSISFSSGIAGFMIAAQVISDLTE